MSKQAEQRKTIGFIKSFVFTSLVAVSFLMMFVVVVDPYDSLSISPPIERLPSSKNQRFAYSAIARSDNFDSLILGTSTTRMLNPAQLDKALGSKFANLSMNTGTAFEQMQIFEKFRRAHNATKQVIWGIDGIWCATKKPSARLTNREFPFWLYDQNKWNDYLHLLNFKTVESAVRQVAIIFGLRRAEYGRDGFRNLNKKGTRYDLDRARLNLYGQTAPKPFPQPLTKAAVTNQERKSWHFPDVQTLEEYVSETAKNTKILFMMVPYHDFYFGAPNGRDKLILNDCKKRFEMMARRNANIDFIDFMIASDFTRTDRFYWDHMHYNDEGAKIIEEALISFIQQKPHGSNIYRTSVSANSD